MEARAVAKYMRISPLKVRMLAGAIKGKSADQSIQMLRFMPQKSAAMLEKVVRSAVANAEQKSINVDSLIVSNVIVDQGPTLKRFHARARGRGSRILKRSSHITVIVKDTSV